MVIANPPFGRRRDENGTDRFQIGAVDTPIVTAEIDQAIAWKALEAMKDDGKAALIIGSELGMNSSGRRDTTACAFASTSLISTGSTMSLSTLR